MDVVSITVMALGTSSPERSDLCVKSVVGSNIFNRSVVLPTSALLQSLPVPSGGLLAIFLSQVFAVFIIIVFFLPKARMDGTMGFVFIVFVSAIYCRESYSREYYRGQ